MSLRLADDCITLKQPPDAGDAPLVYGVGHLFQVSETQAGLLVNRKRNDGGFVDCEDGSDLILFESLDELREANAVPVLRNETDNDQTWVTYPASPVFVPHGADHPHAGTGVLISHAISVHTPEPADLATPETRKAWQLKHREHTRNPRNQSLIIRTMTSDGQLSDGQGISLGDPEHISPYELLPPRIFDGHASRNGALLDGEDLLFPMRDYSELEVGVGRWRYQQGKWQMIDFVQVTSDSGDHVLCCLEPSLIRVPDGDLLFTTRFWHSAPGIHDLHVYRSSDGQHWEKVLHEPDVQRQTPIALGLSTDGTPYLTGTPMTSPDYDRAKLWLWPLAPDYTHTLPPLELFNVECLPPDEYAWWCDHPIGETVRLKSGLHHLISFRVITNGETTGYSKTVNPHSGCYIRELISGN